MYRWVYRQTETIVFAPKNSGEEKCCQSPFSAILRQKKVLIQPPGEPREQHLGDVRPNSVWATQNFMKNKMTGRVDILWCIFEKSKKVKNEVIGTEKFRFWLIYLKTFKKITFFGPCYFNFNFLQFSQKCARLFFNCCFKVLIFPPLVMQSS